MKEVFHPEIHGLLDKLVSRNGNSVIRKMLYNCLPLKKKCMPSSGSISFHFFTQKKGHILLT